MTRTPSKQLALAQRAGCIFVKRPAHPRGQPVAPFVVLASLAFSLNACATYRAVPLTTLPSSIHDAASITRDALAIDRPFLTPVALDLSQPLDSNGVAVLAVISNPDLKAARAREGVADAQAFAAGLLPDPTISFGIDTVIGGPPAPSNIAGSLGLGLSALRTRSAVRAQARAAARQVRLDLAWAEWQTAGQARLQAVRILALERTVALTTAGRDAARSLLDRLLRAAGRGDIMPDQVQAARLSAFDAADRLRVAERDLGAARFELARLLGLPPGFELRLAMDHNTAVLADPVRLTEIALRQRLDLQALQAGYAAQEAAVRKSVLDQFPTLDLTVNASRDTGRNTLLGPAIGFTLPLWNRNRGGIAIEGATRAALGAEYEARISRTRSEIAAAVGALQVVARQRTALTTNLPAIERFAAASRRAASRGDIALATAETAEGVLRDRRVLLAQADRDLAEQMIALELLTGTLRESWPQ